jgi:hypothetical protein
VTRLPMPLLSCASWPARVVVVVAVVVIVVFVLVFVVIVIVFNTYYG